MKAKVTINFGSVKVMTESASMKPSEVEAKAAPYSQELEGHWAVGSASNREAGSVKGTFSVDALEDGTLRQFTDSTGASENIEMKAGESRSFEAVEFNAYTVESEAAVKRPKK